MPKLSPLEYTALTAVEGWTWMLLAGLVAALGAALLGQAPRAAKLGGAGLVALALGVNAERGGVPGAGGGY